MQISGLFPIGIGTSNLKRDFTTTENNCIDNELSKLHKNHLNITSDNNYVLDFPEMGDLKKFLTDELNVFYNKIYSPPENSSQIYITQSWLNITEAEEAHHIHAHPNSFLSGVLYISTLDDDSIAFHTDRIPLFRIESTSINPYNCRDWHVPVHNKQLIIFPSTTIHSVVYNKQQGKKRISLAFNGMIKGEIGTLRDLTRLVL